MADQVLLVRSASTGVEKSLTLAQLNELEQVTVETSNEFVDGKKTFRGPLAREILRLCKAADSAFVICATNRDPYAEVRAGRFRADLFYRLHVVPIHPPNLRERGEDIIEIAENLLKTYAEEEGKSFRRIEPEV